MTLFDQMLTSGGKRLFIGRKKLFLSTEGGRLRILAEDFQLIPKAVSSRRGKNPLLAAGRVLRKKIEDEG